jgi:carbon monoxide dehydrogenase subunit G
MTLKGAIEAGISPARAWELLNDPGALATVMPGLESLEPVDPDTLRGVIVASVGPMTGRFEFGSRIVERRPGQGMVVAVEGAEAATRSRLDARVTLGLTEAGPGRTRVTYLAEVTPGGRLAILGEMVLRVTAGVFLREVSDRIRRRLEELAGPHAAVGPAPEPPSVPSS